MYVEGGRSDLSNPWFKATLDPFFALQGSNEVDSYCFTLKKGPQPLKTNENSLRSIEKLVLLYMYEGRSHLSNPWFRPTFDLFCAFEGSKQLIS